MPKTKLQTVSTISGDQRGLLNSFAELLGDALPQLVGGLLERESIEDIKRSFTEDFASPVMEMFKREVLPIVSEGFNLPGAFFSSSRFQGEQRATEEFLSGKVNPVLASFLESFRNRNLQQKGLFVNALGVASGAATAQTYQTFATQEETLLDRVKGYTGAAADLVSFNVIPGGGGSKPAPTNVYDY